MKKIKMNKKSVWKSKFIDLLIVIIGISIAFQLNNWNESNKLEIEAKTYINSFYEENLLNEASLVSALEFTETNKKNIDTLKQLLLSKMYTDKRVKILATSMMGLARASISRGSVARTTSTVTRLLRSPPSIRLPLIASRPCGKRSA